MFKKVLIMIALFTGLVSIASANSLVTGTNGFDLLEYNVLDGNKLELVFSQSLIEEPLNVDIFDSSNNLLFIESIDYLSGRSIAVINLGEPLLANSTYKLNILSAFGTTGFIVQEDDQLTDIVVDSSAVSSDTPTAQISAEELFNQQSSQNNIENHNSAGDEDASSQIFGEDFELDSDLFSSEEISSNQEANNVEDSTVQQEINLTNTNDTIETNNVVPVGSVNSALEEIDDKTQDAKTGTGSSVITGIPKTGPATNILLLLALLFSGVYFIIRKNVIK
ncbi:MAG: hypothetical protein V3575_06145 [Candidatus Absconditabacteria bacterium]